MNPPKDSPHPSRASSSAGSSRRKTSSVHSGTGPASRSATGQASRRTASRQTAQTHPQRSDTRQTAVRSSGTSRGTPQRKPLTPAERRRRERLRRRRAFRARAIAFLLVLAVVLIVVFVFVKPFSPKTSEETGSSASSDTNGNSSVSAEDVSSSSSVASEEATSEPQSDSHTLTAEEAQEILDDPSMILVNLQNPLTSDAPPTDLKEVCAGNSLSSPAATAFLSMQNAAAADGVDLQLKSGYRNWAYQREHFEGAVQKYLKEGMTEGEAEREANKTILPAGCSEHNTGFAACVCSDDFPDLDVTFASSPTFAWLTQNAADYGFILRYPQGMESMTGVSYQPAHWRYVGVENAARIRDSGLCLEEYIAQLKRIATAQN